MFGAPGTGVHAYRFAGLAVVDVVLTLLAAWPLGRWLRISFPAAAALLFLTGIVMHRLFCVQTSVDRLLFG